MCAAEGASSSERASLAQLDNDALSKVLVSGFDVAAQRKFFEPIPNFLFTRDMAVVCNEHVLIMSPARSARAREVFLARIVFEVSVLRSLSLTHIGTTRHIRSMLKWHVKVD